MRLKVETPNITNLATASALTAVENKIPSVSNLEEELMKLKKTLLILIMANIELLQDFKFTVEIFHLRLNGANLASKNGIANFVKKTDFDNKLKDVTSNKNELNELLKKVKAISTKGLAKDLINKFSILNGAKYFSLIIFQNYLAFIPTKKYIKYFSGTTRVESWKSNGMSEESIGNITKSDSNYAVVFVEHNS